MIRKALLLVTINIQCARQADSSDYRQLYYTEKDGIITILSRDMVSLQDLAYWPQSPTFITKDQCN